MSNEFPFTDNKFNSIQSQKRFNRHFLYFKVIGHHRIMQNNAF